MMQENIQKLEWPEAFGEDSFIEKVVKAHMACTKAGGREYDWEKYNSQPISIRTAWAFLDWLGDLNEIVDHLNIVTSDLAGLSDRTDLSGSELWARYRLLVRTALNEFFRVKEVSHLFYKDLKKMDLINELDRQGMSQMIRDLLGMLIDARNRITHVCMPVIEEERLALFSAMVEEAGLVLVSKTTRERVQTASEVGMIASKVASEFTTRAQEIFGVLQNISDAGAKWIAKNQLVANSL